ncbi:MAG TPA: response regulator [Thermomicrobiales bacterium]|jgi:two-component system, cell cycle response regulator DivK|nr:response regulator [Thermomicrobiales bacterium]
MLRVLIVEDEKPIRELLNDFLSDEGYDTLLAENGQRGVDIARAEQPDLILMDLMLPLLDGFAAMRALKEDPQTRGIPVVVMSANSVLLMHLSHQLLADETLRKPFDLDQVLQVIESRIGINASGDYAGALPN